MTDLLERELRAVLARGAASVPAETIDRVAQIDYQPRIRRAPDRRVMSAAGAALAAGIAAVILVSASAPRPIRASYIRVSYNGPRDARLIGPSLRSQFSVLSGPRRGHSSSASAEGALKQQFAGFVNHIGNSRASQVAGRLSPNNAVYVQGPPGIGAVIIPGTTGVCFGFHTPPLQHLTGPSADILNLVIGGGCSSAAQVEEHGLGMIKFSPDGKSEAIIGMVPDGNTTVTATIANGTIVTIPVVSNMFYVKSSTPLKVRFRTASGAIATIGG